MSFIQKLKTFRETPDGKLTQIVAAKGDEIDIKEEKDGWVRVELVAPKSGAGWVLSTAVGDQSPVQPDTTIDMAAFAKQCWLEGINVNIVPHYLVGIAKARCGTAIDNQLQNDIGPFRLTAAEWNAIRTKTDLGLPLEIAAGDIRDWAMQCGVFAAMASHDLQALNKAMASQPRAARLYLSQLIGVTAASRIVAKGTTTIKEAVKDVTDLPGGGQTADDILARFAKFFPAPDKTTGDEALKLIAADLQTALDAVKKDVI